MQLAMHLNWMQNVGFSGLCDSNEGRVLYIHVTLRFGWKTAKLNISSAFDLTDNMDS